MKFGRKDTVGIAVGIVCVIAICVSGWSIYKSIQKEKERNAPTQQMSPEQMMKMMSQGAGAMMGGGAGGMGGPGQGGNRSERFKHTIELTQTIRTLTKLEGDVAISAEQAAKLLPILAELEKAGKMSQEEAEAQVASIKEILSEAQLTAIETIELPPRQRNVGGGQGRGGPDPEANPFKTERHKKALTDLVESLKQKTLPVQAEQIQE